MERLTGGLITAIIGIVPLIITAVTSWWNRDKALAELEAERLRARGDDERSQ